MIKRTVLYNIKLCTDYISDFSKYIKAFDLFAKEFEKFIKLNYSGSCKIQMTVGCFEFLYPDKIQKEMLPQLHIIASGKNAQNIDELIDYFINTHFDLALHQKLYIDKNPFNKKNDKLFFEISYKRLIIKIHNKSQKVFNPYLKRHKKKNTINE